jgi:uncharacterized membrane-anchored protein YjiN (DUF445 family)
MDLVPIIPDEPKIRREPYNQALTKLLRANDHKIISSYVRFDGGGAHIEIDIQCDKELTEKLQAMKELEIKEDPIYKDIKEVAWDSAEEFIEHLKSRGSNPMRYQGDNPF